MKRKIAYYFPPGSFIINFKNMSQWDLTEFFKKGIVENPLCRQNLFRG